MAGVTDLPFRLLCRRMGAGIAAGEMLTCDVRLWHTEKSRRRMDHSGETEPRVVQIAGGDPQMMVEAAQRNVDAGAQIIDINMGCPAKKVCNKAAGSALMRDEPLVRQILEAVVKAVDVPVTLKMRTGWDADTSQRRRRSPAWRKTSACRRSRCMDARARACIRETPSTKRFARSSRALRFRFSPMATSTHRAKRSSYLNKPAQMA